MHIIECEPDPAAEALRRREVDIAIEKAMGSAEPRGETRKALLAVVAELLDRARMRGTVRQDVTAGDVNMVICGLAAVIRNAAGRRVERGDVRLGRSTRGNLAGAWQAGSAKHRPMGQDPPLALLLGTVSPMPCGAGRPARRSLMWSWKTYRRSLFLYWWAVQELNSAHAFTL